MNLISKFCCTCNEFILVDSLYTDHIGELIRAEDGSFKMTVCHGPFRSNDAMELTDDWVDNLDEPDEEFMLISDQNAEMLRLQFEGDE